MPGFSGTVVPISAGVSALVGAAVIGTGVAGYVGIRLKNWPGYDDALDVFGVHGIAGVRGAVLTGSRTQ